jgi:hypothetical protein
LVFAGPSPVSRSRGGVGGGGDEVSR